MIEKYEETFRNKTYTRAKKKSKGFIPCLKTILLITVHASCLGIMSGVWAILHLTSLTHLPYGGHWTTGVHGILAIAKEFVHGCETLP